MQYLFLFLVVCNVAYAMEKVICFEEEIMYFSKLDNTWRASDGLDYPYSDSALLSRSIVTCIQKNQDLNSLVILPFQSTPTTFLCQSCRTDNRLDLTRILIEHGGADPNRPATKNLYQYDQNLRKETIIGVDQEFPLHIAVHYLAVKTVRLLLDKKANANISNNSSGWTCLHTMCNATREDIEKRFEIIKLLFEHGANSNIRDGTNNTPLFYLARNDEPNGEQLVTLMLEYGADAYATDKNNDTSAQFGRKNNFYKKSHCADFIEKRAQQIELFKQLCSANKTEKNLFFSLLPKEMVKMVAYLVP
jgi:ankyrin repeat protein